MLCLSNQDVIRCLPPLDRRLELAELALVAVVRGDAEMPPKPAVHPRADALVEAMPAWWISGDVLGLKWVAAFPGNRDRGLAQVQGLVVLNDAGTGAPLCVMDARELTIARTAAVSGLAIRSLVQEPGPVAVLGAGPQGRAHLAAAIEILAPTEVRVFDRHPERATSLARWAKEAADVRAVTSHSARNAVSGATLVLSCASLGAGRQALRNDWLAPNTVFISIDEDVYLSAPTAHAARPFLVDSLEQFSSARSGGAFAGFRDPDAAIGGVLGSDPAREATGTSSVFVALGIGLADVILADAVYHTALSLGEGVRLDFG